MRQNHLEILFFELWKARKLTEFTEGKEDETESIFLNEEKLFVYEDRADSLNIMLR